MDFLPRSPPAKRLTAAIERELKRQALPGAIVGQDLSSDHVAPAAVKVRGSRVKPVD